MNIGIGNRVAWEFECPSHRVLEGAIRQKTFRLSRVEWWKEAKEKVMAEIRENGIEINESIAAVRNYSTPLEFTPQINVRDHLQKQLLECHKKIQAHQDAADEYEGWIQVLRANPGQRLKLTQADWLYFFREP